MKDLVTAFVSVMLDEAKKRGMKEPFIVNVAIVSSP